MKALHFPSLGTVAFLVKCIPRFCSHLNFALALCKETSLTPSMQLVNCIKLGHHPQVLFSPLGMSVKKERSIPPLRKMKTMVFLAQLKKNFIFAFTTNPRGCPSQAKWILLILVTGTKTKLGPGVG